MFGRKGQSYDTTSPDSDSEAKHCLARVQAAVKWRKDANYDMMWAKLIKLYANKYDYPELGGYEDVIAPNMLFSTVNVIAPSVSVNYPKIAVTARQPQFEGNAATVEAATNYTWQSGDVHDEFRHAVKDFVIIGHGWCKTSWLFEEKEVDWTEQEYFDEVQSQVMQLQTQMEQAKAQGQDTSIFPSVEDVIASIPAKKTVVKADRPNVERISPFDVFIDPDATRLKNARWIAQRLYIPLSVAKNRKDWKASARKKLVGFAMSAAKEDIDIMFQGEERGKEVDFAVVWEYYDLIEDTVCVFAEGSDDYLQDPDDVPFAFPHPFVMLENYRIPDKLYPMGDVEAIMPLQMELALTRTQMINDRKRFRRMLMYKADMISPDGIAAIQSGDDNAMVEIVGDGPFSEAVAPIGTTALPPEFYNQTAMILDDINLVSGVSEYMRGAVSEIRRTATEANMIQDGANARSADKLAIIERAIGDVAERVVKLAQQFLTTDQVAKIVGPDGASQWIPYSKDDLYGEYDFQVEAGSTMPQNESSRRQSAMQLMDAMAPFMEPDPMTGIPVIDPRKMAEHVLKMGFSIKNPSEFMTVLPPAMGGAPMPGDPSMGGMPPGGPPMGGAPVPPEMPPPA